MQPVLTIAQSRAYDRYLIDHVGIPSLVLMESAARAAFNVIREWVEPMVVPHVVVYCGTGNNGGDGLALARMLLDLDVIVEVRLLGSREDLSDDAKRQYDILTKLNPDAVLEFDPETEDVGEPEIIVDALLGTGSKGELKPAYREAVTFINSCRTYGGSKVLSIDLPTGFDADGGCADSESEAVVRADSTVTMAAPKVGFFQGQSREVTGDVKVANLGTAAGLEELDGAKAYLVEERDVIVRLPEQKRTASKFTRGRVLVICGSRGMTGAAIMAGTTALRTGCGIVNVAVPKSERSLVAQAMPELLTIGLTEQENGAPDLPAWDELAEAIGHADVILVGSGLRPWSGTAELLRKIVTEVDKPMVVDAGALRALVGQTSLLKDRKAATIVTPHSGELASLLERQWEEVDRDRFSAARGFAEEHGVVVAMKGAPTYTFDVDGTAYINSTGNAGLATAGSGDVLAGILVGVLAQMPTNALNACMVGVYLHGLAGDLAAREKTQLGMTATDLTHMLPNAFKQLGAQ
jgi:NAD(P)H-hydrate epimerase